VAKGGNSIPWPILRIASRCAKKVAKGGIQFLSRFCAPLRAAQRRWPRAELNHRHKDFQTFEGVRWAATGHAKLPLLESFQKLALY